MGNGNGQAPIPTGFKGLPIVGPHAINITNWCLTAVVTGWCEGDVKHAVLFFGQIGSVAICPVCQKGYQLQGFGFNPVTRQVEFAFALGAQASPGAGS